MQSSRCLALAALVAAATTWTATTHAAPAIRVPLVKWRLKNGLQVLFSPHRRVPAVTVQVWYHVGSKNEARNHRGVAHMFEHLMFKGSRRVRPEAHARLLAAVGGTVNAFTAQDVTAYHNTLPAQYFDFAVRLEAERMQHLLLTDAALRSEREVVKEEKHKRLTNSPIGRALEAIHALCYKRHPYAWTPAGHIEDLNRTTRKTYQRFFDTYYVPNNATLVVVGDVSEAQVRAAAARHFGRIPRGKRPPAVTAVEPPQRKLRLQRANWPSQLNVVLGAYHVPPARHADIAPLEVLSEILSTGRSSRLHRALVSKGKLALAAGGFVRDFEHPGLFFVYAVGLPTHGLSAMRDKLLGEIARVARAGVTAAELKKARNQLSTRLLRRLQTVSGLANQIGMSTYLLGDPLGFINGMARIDKVRSADIKRVASRYLVSKNLSLVLLPASTTRAPSKSKGGQR